MVQHGLDAESEEVRELLASYDSELQGMQDDVLQRASGILGKEQTVPRFHGIIGGKYRTWADVVHVEFSDPEMLVRQWLAGLAEAAAVELEEERKKYGRSYGGRQANRAARLLHDDMVWRYIRLFHERNFYRYLPERTRSKPSERLWSVWFGLNKMTWGLLIAPAFRRGEWRNDVSEIRRAAYNYWTVGHAVAEGFINPDEREPHRIGDLTGLVQFYKNVLKRISSSQYEQAVVDEYAKYLDDSADPLSEPLLIPEIRYAGLDSKHKYRLDFAVLNSHVMEFTGFELSPHSTHMSVKGITTKTQKDINADLAERWEKEMDKRRAYFDEFGIRIDTFTDGDLANIPSCFSRIAAALSARSETLPTIGESLASLRGLDQSA